MKGNGLPGSDGQLQYIVTTVTTVVFAAIDDDEDDNDTDDGADDNDDDDGDDHNVDDDDGCTTSMVRGVDGRTDSVSAGVVFLLADLKR